MDSSKLKTVLLVSWLCLCSVVSPASFHVQWKAPGSSSVSSTTELSRNTEDMFVVSTAHSMDGLGTGTINDFPVKENSVVETVSNTATADTKLTATSSFSSPQSSLSSSQIKPTAMMPPTGVTDNQALENSSQVRAGVTNLSPDVIAKVPESIITSQISNNDAKLSDSVNDVTTTRNPKMDNSGLPESSVIMKKDIPIRTAPKITRTEPKTTSMLTIPEEPVVKINDGCLPPPKVLSATAKYQSTSIGSVVFYECKLGSPSSRALSVCTFDKTWTPVNLLCPPTECPTTLPHVEGAVTSVGDMSIGALAVFVCDVSAGYSYQSGGKYSECGQDGAWTIPSIKCVLPTTSKPTTTTTTTTTVTVGTPAPETVNSVNSLASATSERGAGATPGGQTFLNFSRPSYSVASEPKDPPHFLNFRRPSHPSVAKQPPPVLPELPDFALPHTPEPSRATPAGHLSVRNGEPTNQQPDPSVNERQPAPPTYQPLPLTPPPEQPLTNQQASNLSKLQPSPTLIEKTVTNTQPSESLSFEPMSMSQHMANPPTSWRPHVPRTSSPPRLPQPPVVHAPPPAATAAVVMSGKTAASPSLPQPASTPGRRSSSASASSSARLAKVNAAAAAAAAKPPAATRPRTAPTVAKPRTGGASSSSAGRTAIVSAASQPRAAATAPAAPTAPAAASNLRHPAQIAASNRQRSAATSTSTKSSVPASPQSNRPAAPQSNRPAVPQSNRPAVPQSNRPAVPQPNRPTVPQSNRPAVPQSNRPAVPQSNRPTVPQSNRPTVPQSNRPAAPQSNRPTAPQSNRPAVPQSNRPAVPQSNRPAANSRPQRLQTSIKSSPPDNKNSASSFFSASLPRSPPTPPRRQSDGLSRLDSLRKPVPDLSKSSQPRPHSTWTFGKQHAIPQHFFAPVNKDALSGRSGSHAQTAAPNSRGGFGGANNKPGGLFSGGGNMDQMLSSLHGMSNRQLDAMINQEINKAKTSWGAGLSPQIQKFLFGNMGTPSGQNNAPRKTESAYPGMGSMSSPQQFPVSESSGWKKSMTSQKELRANQLQPLPSQLPNFDLTSNLQSILNPKPATPAPPFDAEALIEQQEDLLKARALLNRHASNQATLDQQLATLQALEQQVSDVVPPAQMLGLSTLFKGQRLPSNNQMNMFPSPSLASLMQPSPQQQQLNHFQQRRHQQQQQQQRREQQQQQQMNQFHQSQLRDFQQPQLNPFPQPPRQQQPSQQQQQQHPQQQQQPPPQQQQHPPQGNQFQQQPEQQELNRFQQRRQRQQRQRQQNIQLQQERRQQQQSATSSRQRSSSSPLQTQKPATRQRKPPSPYDFMKMLMAQMRTMP